MSDRGTWVALLLACAACGPVTSPLDAGGVVVVVDAGVDAGPPPDAFADRVVSFTPGAGAGFGQTQLPGVVLGPPQGNGAGSGSFDVVSLGNGGEIILGLDGLWLTDGPGVDLLVFENAFAGYPETGAVAVSDDGMTWKEWPCDADNSDAGFPGCAGTHPVFSSSENGISPTDPSVAGGDGFDLSALGVTAARFVRIRDTGKNKYAPPSGGFDLDAISVVHAIRPDGGAP